MKIFKTTDGKYVNLDRIVSFGTSNSGDVFGSLGMLTNLQTNASYGFGTIQLAKLPTAPAAKRWLDKFVAEINAGKIPTVQRGVPAEKIPTVDEENMFVRRVKPTVRRRTPAPQNVDNYSVTDEFDDVQGELW